MALDFSRRLHDTGNKTSHLTARQLGKPAHPPGERGRRSGERFVAGGEAAGLALGPSPALGSILPGGPGLAGGGWFGGASLPQIPEEKVT